ncbi:hypothetical protein NLJ89_g9418 [Agrocybe chaxingu]|uniref:Aldehyde dehydrogenase domain-containing protein n=1 Tax=Agrocybe chaxingu TaxID=84603 RepID=A0A9W8JTL3_9AGAR|nr:hypothetical protein NLJ89_g9418 [Agrocybe chaxingu]
MSEKIRAGFVSRKLRDVTYRKCQLVQLMYLIKDNSAHFEEAFKKDLGRPVLPVLQARMLEIDPTIAEAKTQWKNVGKWAKPTKPVFGVNFFSMKPITRKEPKGTVLVISPFNCPVWLSLGPVYLDHDVVRVVNGAVPEPTKSKVTIWAQVEKGSTVSLLQLVLRASHSNNSRARSQVACPHRPHDGPQVGDEDAFYGERPSMLARFASRWTTSSSRAASRTSLSRRSTRYKYEEFYPDPAKRAAASDSFSRMITPQATARVAGLLEKTQGKVVFSGEVDKENNCISPTAVRDVSPGDSLMGKEIFGPVLPFVPVEDIDEAIKFVNEREHPLALYVFSQDD